MIVTTNQLARPLQTYFDAYRAGDRDRLASAFTDDAVVIFNRGQRVEGLDAIRKAHEQIGVFCYRVERVLDAGQAQVVEGALFALKDGKEIEDIPLPFAAVADLSDDGEKIRSLSITYNTVRLREAMERARGG
jgi:hypothetical protein